MIKKIYKAIFPEKLRNVVKIKQRQILGLFYRGDNFHCNCCGKSFKNFLPAGRIKRSNALCPHCGSLERTRLLQHFLTEQTDIYQKKHLNTLHFAPEPCLKKKLKSNNPNYVDGDLNPDYASYVVDITKIQYPDNFFDYIICSHVLAHVPNEEKAIEELYRVLKPGGKAIIMSVLDTNTAKTFSDPALSTPEQKEKAYGEPDIFRLHGMDLHERISDKGFGVKTIDYRKQLPKTVQEKEQLGDGKREVIFLAEKA